MKRKNLLTSLLVSAALVAFSSCGQTEKQDNDCLLQRIVDNYIAEAYPDLDKDHWPAGDTLCLNMRINRGFGKHPQKDETFIADLQVIIGGKMNLTTYPEVMVFPPTKASDSLDPSMWEISLMSDHLSLTRYEQLYSLETIDKSDWDKLSAQQQYEQLVIRAGKINDYIRQNSILHPDVVGYTTLGAVQIIILADSEAAKADPQFVNAAYQILDGIEIKDLGSKYKQYLLTHPKTKDPNVSEHIDFGYEPCVVYGIDRDGNIKLWN